MPIHTVQTSSWAVYGSVCPVYSTVQYVLTKTVGWGHFRICWRAKCQWSGLYLEAPSLLADVLSHIIGQPFTLSGWAALMVFKRRQLRPLQRPAHNQSVTPRCYPNADSHCGRPLNATSELTKCLLSQHAAGFSTSRWQAHRAARRWYFYEALEGPKSGHCPDAAAVSPGSRGTRARASRVCR